MVDKLRLYSILFEGLDQMADIQQASKLLGDFGTLLEKEEFDDAKKIFHRIKVL